jgi:class 3 adenylate cyclase
MMWEEPSYERLLRRLASFSRLILFDKRGTGLSDRVPDDRLPVLEERMDDVRAVMDAAGSEAAVLFGHSEGGNMSVLFAATYPERTIALVTFAIFACRVWSEDYPWAPRREEREAWYEMIERDWGGLVDIATLAPSRAADPAFQQWAAAFFRRSASPGAAVALARMNTLIDIRDILPSVRVPTLVLHRVHDRDANIEEARYIARHIPDAKLVELPGDDHLVWSERPDEVADEIEEFLTGTRPVPEPDRVLATVLFTDIVGSTERAAALGDRRWGELLAAHHAAVRQELDRFRGREVNTTGDGFLALFDGPARAVRCAVAIAAAVRNVGLEVRAGVHTGECAVRGDDVEGLAVHIGARVSALAGANEVYASSTVKDLVAGSGIEFDDRGEHELKGVPGSWRVYAVRAASAAR